MEDSFVVLRFDICSGRSLKLAGTTSRDGADGLVSLPTILELTVILGIYSHRWYFIPLLFPGRDLRLF